MLIFRCDLNPKHEWTVITLKTDPNSYGHEYQGYKDKVGDHRLLDAKNCYMCQDKIDKAKKEAAAKAEAEAIKSLQV